jgi:hypothetical protein
LARQCNAWLGLARRGEARQGMARQGTAGRGKARQRENGMFITIEIQGVTPLILNRFSDAAAMASTNGDRGSSAGIDRGTPQEIAASKLYIGINGKPMIPSPNLLRSIVDGGSFTKIGKKQVTTARSSMLYSCLAIEAAEIALAHKQPWKVDTRAVRIPSTGGRILAHRPMFDDWSLSFEVELDTTILNAKLLRQVVDDSGKRIGLGDFRPATKGPFGRFVVSRWHEQSLKKLAA